MKQGVWFVCISLGWFVGPSIGQDKSKDVKVFTSSLLPLQIGTRWVYRGNEDRDRIGVSVDKMEPVKRRVKTATGEKSELIASYVLRATSGDKTLPEQLAITEDGIYRHSAAGKEIAPPLKLLALPPKKGEAWLVDSESENVPLKGAMVVDQGFEKVMGRDVPVWTVTTRDFYIGKEKFEATYVFSEGIGIVKQHVRVGKFDLKLDLLEFKPAGPVGGVVAPPPLLPLPSIK